MKSRVLFAVAAILAGVGLGFGQEANNYFLYLGGGETADCSYPLTYGGECWQGTRIPDGTTVEVYKNGVLCWSFDMNSYDVGCPGPAGGFFVQWDPCMADNGAQLFVRVSHEGCTYTSSTVTVAGAPEPQFYYLSQSDWTCTCGTPGCEVKDEQSGSLLGGSKSTGPSGSSASTP